MTEANAITNLNKLLHEEKQAFRDAYYAWSEARARKDWIAADKARARFYWWDVQLGTDGLWYPIFEYPLNRQRRAFLRMRKYGVDVYPWTKDLIPD